jgi:hypothetical protein
VRWQRAVAGTVRRRKLLVDQRISARVDGEQNEARIAVSTGKLFVDRSKRGGGVWGQGKISRERGKRFHGHPMLRVCCLNRDLSIVCTAFRDTDYNHSIA